MLETYIVPLKLKEKVKQIGFDEIDRVFELRFWQMIAFIGWLLFFLVLYCWLWMPDLEAGEPKILTVSWYSIQSLKDEGTWKYSKGVCADGSIFNDNLFTCATRLFALGDYLRITNSANGKVIVVKVTDRIGKRFAKTRIDLSKRAFSTIAPLKQGLISCKIELLNRREAGGKR